MAKVWEGYRNQYTTLDAKRAKAPKQHQCEAGCGAWIPARRRFCLPCYDARLMANIAANRPKYAGKYRKAKVSPTPAIDGEG